MDFDDLTAIDHAMKDRLSIVQYSLNNPCEVYMWGTNSNYTLGTGNQHNRPVPELLDALRKKNISIKQVAMHKFHSVFVAHDGRVFSCGHGQGGRLGLATEQAVLTPQPVKLGTCPGTGAAEECKEASVGKDHTVLLMESGSVWTCGLNSHHQLGHSPPPPFLLSPRSLSPRLFKSGGTVCGVSAARFHTVIWSSGAVYTCGLNAGQLGHLKTPERTIIVPKQVSTLIHKDCVITHVAASDGATVVVTKKGDIYVLHEYQCRKIASRQLDVAKVVVVGGHLDSKLGLDMLIDKGGEELRVLVSTSLGKLLLWQESSLQLTRCVFTLNRLLIVTDIVMNRNQLLFVTKDGEAFEGEVKVKKSRKQSQSQDGLPKSPPFTVVGKSAFHKFLDKENCEVVKVKKLPHVHRAVHITSDLKGRNFAVIQTHPKTALFEVPQIETCTMREELLTLLQEASEDDPIHDVVFQVRLQKFPAHKFVVASQSERLAKLIAEQEVPQGNQVPLVKLHNTEPEIFLQILIFMYTKTCDLLTPGACSIKILKPAIKDKSFDKQDIENLESSYLDTNAVSALEVSSSPESKKTKVKPWHKKVAYNKCKVSNTCPWRDPLRLTREAANRFGLLALELKLGEFRYEDGCIVEKENRPCQFTYPRFDRNEHRDMYDVTLQSEDGRQLKAHKCILAARLDYFNSMFSHGWIEASHSHVVKLPLPYAILQAVVDFLYQDESVEVMSSEDLDLICNVLMVADQLFIARLKEVCEVALANLLTLKNFAQVFQFSGMYNADQLKQCCMQFICLNLSAILESRALDMVSEELLQDLAKYYCELNPVMCRRVITPYSNVPSDNMFQSIWNTYPISWEHEEESRFLEESNKKLMKSTKKKPRGRKNSYRSRNESISSNDENDVKSIAPLDFGDLTEMSEERNGSLANGTSPPQDITLSLSKLLTSEGKSNTSPWITISNHSKQQKIVQARLKVISAVRESPSIIDEMPQTFTKLTSGFCASRDRPVGQSPQGIDSNLSIATPVEQIQQLEAPVSFTMSSMEFPQLMREPAEFSSNTRITSKVSESKKIPKVSQKQRKKLAMAHSMTSLGEQLDRINEPRGWGNVSPANNGAGLEEPTKINQPRGWGDASPSNKSTGVELPNNSPTSSYCLGDVMKHELHLMRKPSSPIPTSSARLGWGEAAASPPQPCSPPVTNPWLKLEATSPQLSHAVDSHVNFCDIIADEKKQKENWTKMRTKPLELTQMEDQAMEDLLVFYNAAGAGDERITVHRVITGVMPAPIWITSHH